MKSIKRRNLLTLLVIGLFSISMFVIPSVSGIINNPNYNEFSIEATDIFVEDFEDTVFLNGSSTAHGWGQGTVTNERNFTWNALDFTASVHPLTDIDVEGKRVYAASYDEYSASPSIEVFDIQNVYDISKIGDRNSFDGQMSIAADGDVVYVGQDYDGYTGTINTYNWTVPHSHGDWISSTTTDGSVTDIELNGHLAYYTCFNSTSGYSLRVLYAENPDIPVNITASWTDSSLALGLAVDSGLVYVAAHEDGFYVVNASDKHNFFTEGYVDTPGNATDVVVDGRYGYLAAGEAGIFSLDLIDKANPQIIGHIDTPGYARKLVLQGRTLFVADGSGVVVLDVADPHNPTWVTRMTMTPYVYDVDLFGGTLVVGSADGLHTFSIQAGKGIADISQTWYENSYSERQAFDVRVRGDLAYIAGGTDGFYILNIRDPNNPILVGNYSVLPSESLTSIDIDGNVAHLVCSTRWYLLDISDPTDIKYISHGIGSGLKDIYAHGGMAYLAVGSLVDVINCTDPYNWVILDFLSVGTNITSVWVEGRYLYAAEYTDGTYKDALWIYDISDFTAPVLLDAVADNSKFLDICVDGDILYSSEQSHSVVFNLTNPRSGFWSDWSYPESNGVWSFGNYMLSTNAAGSTDIINTTDINNIHLLHSNLNASAGLKITTNGDYTYVANQSSLVILRHFLSAGDTYIPGTTFAQSLEIDSFAENIISATLFHHDFIPLGSNIDYFMSADGGTHWEAVTHGAEHIFVNIGNDLRWRAEITGAEDRSPHLYEITIDLESEIPAGIDLPWWVYAAIGGGLVLIILIIVIVVVVKKKKKIATR